jgi:hypothetical protein
VRESCAEVMERVLAYRAYLLAAVARQLPSLQQLDKVASLASLNTASATDLLDPLEMRNSHSPR